MPAWQSLLIDHLRERQSDKDIRRNRERARANLSKAGDELTEENVEEKIEDILIANHNKATKEMLASAISAIYWKGLREHLFNREKKITVRDIADELKVSVSQLSRWSKETLPEPSKFFVSLLKWKVDAKEIEPYWQRNQSRLGDSPESIFNAENMGTILRLGVCLVLQLMRVKDIKKRLDALRDNQELLEGLLKELRASDDFDKKGKLKFKSLTPDELFGLECVKKDRDWDLFVTKGFSAALGDRIRDEMNRACTAENVPPVVVNLEATVKQWYIPYLLFTSGCPNWKCLHGE